MKKKGKEERKKTETLINNRQLITYTYYVFASSGFFFSLLVIFQFVIRLHHNRSKWNLIDGKSGWWNFYRISSLVFSFNLFCFQFFFPRNANKNVVDDLFCSTLILCYVYSALTTTTWTTTQYTIYRYRWSQWSSWMLFIVRIFLRTIYRILTSRLNCRNKLGVLAYM